MCVMAVSFGQVVRKAQYAPMKLEPIADQNSGSNQVKGGGDVIWQTSFNWADASVERGWSLPAGWTIVDVSDLGNPWMWANDTIKWGTSSTLIAPSYMATKADGFLVLPMQAYNDRDPGGDVAADSYIMTPKIDCSAVSSVVVKFTQAWNLCCLGSTLGNLEMQVTIDDGIHWATYDCQYNIAANNSTPERFRNVELNISDVAVGSPNVQIRFNFHGGSMYYYWMVDDLKLVQGYDNDLVLEDYWMGFDGGGGETVGQINYWPLSQMGMAGGTSGTVGGNYFRAALLNRGNQDSEDTKLSLKGLKNGTEILADASVPGSIWTLERDTAEIVAPFQASDYGDYQFNYEVVSASTDAVPVNNKGVMRFTVTDTLAHRADFSAEAGANTGGWQGGDNAGDMTGVVYDIYAPCEINSITAYIRSYTASRTPSFQYVLIKEIDGVREEWMTSEVVDVDASMIGTYVTLPLTKDGETEFLTVGRYATMVRMWATDPGDPTNGSNGMSVGYDMTTKPDFTLMYHSVGGAWWSTGNLNMVGFNINSSGAPTQAPVTFNVDMNLFIKAGEFNPGTDLVNVSGVTPTWNTTIAMTDTDGDGFYTATVDNLTVAGDLNYKYSINSKSEEYPMTTNPNRIARVGYFNVFNDTYNYGRPVFILNVDMAKQITAGTFIPGTDTVKVTGLVPIWSKKVNMTDTDGDGIYTYAVQNLPYNAAIDYKYSINSVPETFATRKLTLKYWNIRNDMFNEASSGLNTGSLTSSFLVYPNPNSGSFNVTVSNTEATDLVIKLTNISGQVIYQNLVTNVTNHQETIGKDLPKGMYFLSVNNGKEIKVQKVVVE
jgi:hypothetical protein